MSTMVSFKTSIAGRKAIKKIVARAAAIVEKQGRTVDRRGLEMDLAACHANGNRLRLDDLAKADDFNLLHDVVGIHRHLDRETGKLMDHFVPRFTARRRPKWISVDEWADRKSTRLNSSH